MTRIFTDGAEFGDLLFFDITNNQTTAIARSGNYAYRNSYGIKYISSLSELYFRIAVRISNITESTVNTCFIPSFQNSPSDAVHAHIYVKNTDSKLYLNAGGASEVATGTIVFASATWYLIEVYLLVDDNPNGRCIVKVNGVVDIDYTGDTKNGATTTVNKLYIGSAGYNDVYFDDLALNDTNGSVDNSWCGDGHVELLIANGNGDVNDWDGSDGDSVNNYLLVDDIPKDDDTTYVKTTITEQDMYNVSDYNPAGGKLVQRVFAECRARDATAGAGAIKIGYKHGGTVYLCSDARILGSSYVRVVGDDALSDPSDSTIWSEADLDAIQFVVECSSSSSSTSSSSSSSSTTSSSSSTEIP